VLGKGIGYSYLFGEIYKTMKINMLEIPGENTQELDLTEKNP
jgi:hypothetical protein